MSSIIRKLSWCVHRALCYVGIHAADEVSRMDLDSGEPSFTVVGTFCPVCMKHVDYEEKTRAD